MRIQIIAEDFQYFQITIFENNVEPLFINVVGKEINFENFIVIFRQYAKIFFLIDGQAISYAESYMSFIEHYKLATIIGQPTAGTNGNVNTITLPGGYSIRFTGMKVLKHDGSQHHGIGIIPNIYVEQTANGIKEGRDEILERAIDEALK